MRAAGEVDDAAMLLEQREVAPIEDAMRLARERKQADERIGDAQQGRELGRGLYAGQRFRPAAVGRRFADQAVLGQRLLEQRNPEFRLLRFAREQNLHWGGDVSIAAP